MSSIIKSIKGTRDYYPDQMAVRTFLYQTARKVSESFGYQEIDGPFLEPIELYAAKSGEELVKEQSFVFEDRSGDWITLRPELTPSIARMVAQRQKQMIYPLRWWSWGPFWRYEQPQKGRTREFFQWNIDLIGIDTPEADAEMVAVAASFLQEASLSSSQVKILINNRQLMELKLSEIGIRIENRQNIFKLIDRRDKMSPKNWDAYALEIGLNPIQISHILKLLNNYDLWQESNDLIRFFEVIESLGVADYVRFDPHVIRGLDYYTGTVFEVWDQDREFRAILGGGRYDSLVEAVGGDPLPAVGFAMGDLVISLVLEYYKCLSIDEKGPVAPVLVTVFNEETLLDSFRIATTLRGQGFDVVCYPSTAKLSKQFRFGDKMGNKVAVIIGPDEIENGEVSIKDLQTGFQGTYPEQELQARIEDLIGLVS